MQNACRHASSDGVRSRRQPQHPLDEILKRPAKRTPWPERGAQPVKKSLWSSATKQHVGPYIALFVSALSQPDNKFSRTPFIRAIATMPASLPVTAKNW
jgi:hypothetical protein